MSGGLTPTGMVTETLDQVIADIATAERSTIDSGIDTSAESLLGLVNAALAAPTADGWALLAQIYAALDPATAIGQQLDVCCSLTGTVRKAASSTVVAMSGTATPNTTFAGAVLDINGNVVTAGKIIAQIVGRPDLQFCNASTFTVGPSGNVGGADQVGSSNFVAMQPGAIPCLAGTLTVISPSVSGLTSITNPTDGALGSAIESDAALRIRRINELVPPNGATNDSIRETLLAVKGTGPGFAGVLSAQVFENDLPTTDPVTGLPGHSILCVIFDNGGQAKNNDIAQAIYNSKSNGVLSWDANTGTSGIALDSAGVSHTIGFARTSVLTMFIAITIAVDNTFDPVGGPSAVAALLATYGNTLVSGQKVVVLQFVAQALRNIPGVRDVPLFAVDSHSSPVNAADIAVPITSIARFDSSRIVVSTVAFT